MQALQCCWGRGAHVGAALCISVCPWRALGRGNASAFFISLLLFGIWAGFAPGSPCPPVQPKQNPTLSSCLSAEPRFAVIPAANLSFSTLRAACSSLNILKVLMTFKKRPKLSDVFPAHFLLLSPQIQWAVMTRLRQKMGL